MGLVAADATRQALSRRCFSIMGGGEEGRALLEPPYNRAGDGGRGISGGAEDVLHKWKIWYSIREVKVGKPLIELMSLVTIVPNFRPVDCDLC